MKPIAKYIKVYCVLNEFSYNLGNNTTMVETLGF